METDVEIYLNASSFCEFISIIMAETLFLLLFFFKQFQDVTVLYNQK